MASAFGTLASGGVRYAPFGIWRVEDAYGQVLEEHIVSGRQALDSRLVYQVVDMMKGVVDYGTGNVVRRLGFDKPAAGKTGTTNGYKDAWFTGFTPTLTTSVWVGHDQHESMKDLNGSGITGGRGAAPIWADFMIQATEGEPPRPFLQPAGIRIQRVDPMTGESVYGDPSRSVEVSLKEDR
jgi:penicillin-binding protein 1A